MDIYKQRLNQLDRAKKSILDQSETWVHKRTSYAIWLDANKALEEGNKVGLWKYPICKVIYPTTLLEISHTESAIYIPFLVLNLEE